jgi:hypothetical protein
MNFKGDKNPSHDFLRREVKPSAHIVRFYGMLKMHAEHYRYASPAKLTDISRKVSPYFTTRCICWYLTTLVDESEMIRLRCGRTIDQRSRSAWDALYDTTLVPDRPLVRDPIRTLLEYSYELGVWDFDPVHILILIEVCC